MVSKESPEEPSLRHLAGQAVRGEVYVSARKAKSKANFNNMISHSPPTPPPPHTHTCTPSPHTGFSRDFRRGEASAAALSDAFGEAAVLRLTAKAPGL